MCVCGLWGLAAVIPGPHGRQRQSNLQHDSAEYLQIQPAILSVHANIQTVEVDLFRIEFVSVD